VNISFTWSDTKEGKQYWQRLNEKLIERTAKYYLHSNKDDRNSIISKGKLLEALRHRCRLGEFLYEKVKYN
jgi:hypothetical protein